MPIPPNRDLKSENAIIKLLTDYGEIQRFAVVAALKKDFSEDSLNLMIDRLVQLKRIVAIQDKLKIK